MRQGQGKYEVYGQRVKWSARCHDGLQRAVRPVSWRLVHLTMWAVTNELMQFFRHVENIDAIGQSLMCPCVAWVP